MDTLTMLTMITDYYLTSREFNGLPVSKLDGDSTKIANSLTNLLATEKITLNFGDRNPNMHILAVEPESLESQLTKLNKQLQSGILDFCVYPSKMHLHEIEDINKYEGKPFTKLLALGVPQLTYRAFDMKVLEFYRNEPRYEYKVNDIIGTIFDKDESKLEKCDEILIKNFGFAYDKDIQNRYVVAFIYYLSCLTPKHQIHWKANLVEVETKLHPDFVRIAHGEWGEGVSVFDAFFDEIRLINEMTENIFNVSLFKNHHDKPKKFGFLIRTTLEEFHGFIHLLDKMLSDNLNMDFFKKDSSINIEENGRIKGTINLLEEWLGLRFRPEDPQPIEYMIKFFKDIRKRRMKPAHKIIEDDWDNKYFTEQRAVIIEAYKHIRTLRQIFAGHPKARDIDIPNYLLQGKIWTY
jgi:hypothetical protein